MAAFLVISHEAKIAMSSTVTREQGLHLQGEGVRLILQGGEEVIIVQTMVRVVVINCLVPEYKLKLQTLLWQLWLIIFILYSTKTKDGTINDNNEYPPLRSWLHGDLPLLISTSDYRLNCSNHKFYRENFRGPHYFQMTSNGPQLLDVSNYFSGCDLKYHFTWIEATYSKERKQNFELVQFPHTSGVVFLLPFKSAKWTCIFSFRLVVLQQWSFD